jgi:hypothetical protein
MTTASKSKRKTSSKPEQRRRSQTRNIGNSRSQLNTDDIPGYSSRWVNDDGNKIHVMTVEDDWEFTYPKDFPNSVVSVGDADITNTDTLGEKISRPVGAVGRSQSNATAFLLKKKQKYFDADFKTRMDAITEKESQLRPDTFDDSNARGTLKIK